MDQLGFLLFCCCALSSCFAQTRDRHSQGPPRFSNSFPVVFLVMAILVLTTTFTVIICSKFRFKASRPTFPIVTNPDELETESEPDGVDKEIVDLIPMLRFSALKGSTKDLECSVCLSKFEDIEILRVLPKCKHVFHRHCLDPWLESHSGCPLCRRKVEAEDLAIFKRSGRFKFLQVELFEQTSPGSQGLRTNDEMEKKRFRRLSSIPGSNADSFVTSRYLLPSGERSISEITSLSRFAENGGSVGIKEGSSSSRDGKQEIVWNLWSSIAKRIVEGLVGAERQRDCHRILETPDMV
ncbi:RING-H2 finger protein ATL5-like [Aristolochia californica]|uniref:RING-H2 finger protein ATL5-like n=1 Tax=Aristolochia californica TaxID=171875 RepID=UPI0035DF2699